MGTPIPERIARHCADAVDAHADRLVELARSLHAEPELAFAEHRSAEKVSGLLEREGFAVERGTAGLDTAFVARTGSGPLTVAFCAEYDALPGIGHACGHNLIAASSVGAGLALRDVADELGLTVLVVGTPAEEDGGGKIVMLDAGVFDDVALAMMAHPAPIDVGAPRPLALAEWEVRYRGTPSHSAMAPHLGVNAADALTVAEVAIGVGRQHFEPEQLVHGIVTARRGRAEHRPGGHPRRLQHARAGRRVAATAAAARPPLSRGRGRRHRVLVRGHGRAGLRGAAPRPVALRDVPERDRRAGAHAAGARAGARAAGRQHRHGQRQPRRAEHPPGDRASTPAARSTTSRSSRRPASGPPRSAPWATRPSRWHARPPPRPSPTSSASVC